MSKCPCFAGQFYFVLPEWSFVHLLIRTRPGEVPIPQLLFWISIPRHTCFLSWTFYTLHILLVERGYNFQPKFRIKMSYFTSFLGKPTRSFMNGTDFLPQNPHWTIWTCMWHYYWCHTFYKLSNFHLQVHLLYNIAIVSIIGWTLDSSSIWSLCYWHCCITLLTNIRKWNRSIKGTRTADWTVVCGIQDHSLYMLVHTTQRI